MISVARISDKVRYVLCATVEALGIIGTSHALGGCLYVSSFICNAQLLPVMFVQQVVICSHYDGMEIIVFRLRMNAMPGIMTKPM